MLRFDQFTVGGTNTNLNEFGSASDSLDYLNLKSYSPMHNISDRKKYPNFLLITGDSDDRVPPHHSYKFLATLQSKARKESLYQLYIIPGAGHGGAATIEDWVNITLFKYLYLKDELGIDIKALK